MNPPSHHKNEVKTVRETLMEYKRYPYGTELERHIDGDQAEAAINAYFVSVLEKLKERATQDHSASRSIGADVFSVNTDVIDAAISKYKPTPEHQKRIDFHRDVSDNAAKYKSKAQEETKE